jgi:transcriptional regulator with XRE-family HTH domain
MPISKRLDLFIEQKYKTAKALATTIDVSPNAISQIVNGKNLPSAKVLIPLLQTGISIDWLLTGEGSMLRDPEQTTKKINQGNGSIAQVGQTNTASQNNSSGVDMQVQIDNLTKELGAAKELLASKDETIEALRAHIESLKIKVQ